MFISNKINVINDLVPLIGPMYNFIKDEDRLEEDIVTLQTEKSLEVYDELQTNKTVTGEYLSMINKKIDKCNNRRSMHTIDMCFPNYSPADREIIKTMCDFYHGRSFLSDGMRQLDKCAGEVLLDAISDTPIGKLAISYDVIVDLDRMSQYILKNYVSVKETESDIVFSYKDIKNDLNKIIKCSKCQKIVPIECSSNTSADDLYDNLLFHTVHENPGNNHDRREQGYNIIVRDFGETYLTQEEIVAIIRDYIEDVMDRQIRTDFGLTAFDFGMIEAIPFIIDTAYNSFINSEFEHVARAVAEARKLNEEK